MSEYLDSKTIRRRRTDADSIRRTDAVSTFPDYYNVKQADAFGDKHEVGFY